jgi:methionine synthase I (cobalamin-dependent)
LNTQTAFNISMGVTDDFDVDIVDLTLDYIIITDGADGTELTTVNLDIGGTVTAYASGYNLTGPTYVGLVEVNWLSTGGGFSQSLAQFSTYTAGFVGGSFTQTGQNLSKVPQVTDTFQVDIAPPTVDYIIITDGADGPALGTVNLDVGQTVTAFASGYNNTGNTYVSLVSVDWVDNGGSWSPSTGTSSTFTAGVVGGSFNQVAQNIPLYRSTNC